MKSLLTLKPFYVYMTFFFQPNTIKSYIKNIMARLSFNIGGWDFEAQKSTSTVH